MKRLMLLLFGMTPFILGGLLNHIILNSFTLLPYAWIAVCMYLYWFIIAFVFARLIKRKIALIVFLNLPAAIVLLLLGVQEVILKAYWSNAVGLWTQFFYLPFVKIGFRLTNWSHTVFSAYCASFLLMVFVTFIAYPGQFIDLYSKIYHLIVYCYSSVKSKFVRD